MYQKVMIIGNVGKEPELRYTPGGTAVASFSVGVNKSRKKEDGSWDSQTAWFKVTCWSKLAENVEKYIQKGNRVFVEGELVFDPQTGSPKTYAMNYGRIGASFEINAGVIRNLTPKPANAGGNPSTEYDDAIPF